MTTTDRPNPRVTLRNEEILIDLLTRIRLTGTPDEEQLRLMCEYMKLVNDDVDLFVHLKSAEKKAAFRAAYERCQAVLLEHRDQVRALNLMNHPAWR